MWKLNKIMIVITQHHIAIKEYFRIYGIQLFSNPRNES